MASRSAFALFILVGFASSLIGCANPAELSDLDEKEIQSVDDRDLCEAYYHGQADNVRSEINRRNLISERRWTQVDAQKITTGMTECAIFAALGSPGEIVARTSSDPVKMFIYRRNGRLINIYYSDNRVSKIERKKP